MALVAVTEQNFASEVLQSDQPVLVEFAASWSGPCKAAAPELEALAAELAGKVKVLTVDIDRSQRLAQQLGVQTVPTFVVFHQGRPVTGRAGPMKKAQLREMLEPLLPRAAGALTVPEVVALLQRRQISLVDTRDAQTYRRSHLPGAVNLPLEEIETRLAELHMLPAVPVVYCRSGDKTKELAERLAQQGVDISFLDGGVLAWEAEGYDLDRPD